MAEQLAVTHGKQLINELCAIIRELPDAAVGELLGTGSLDSLLCAILEPTDVKKYGNIAKFLYANKTRASLLALIRYAITHNYAFQGINKEGQAGFVSPLHLQFFDDGVMFMESDKPFEGFIGLYRNGKLNYAIATRDTRPGEQIGPEHLAFVDAQEFNEQVKKIPAAQVTKLEAPIQRLRSLLNTRDNDESKYQELLEDYPWLLGAQYKTIQRHRNLDDKNIPDFTGVRVHDGDRDIFELKPPFMRLFRKDEDFHSDFNDAWNQAERYLNFVREEKDYLSRKGLRFDNPRCYLIAGYGLSANELRQLSIKQKMNAFIQLWTYNDLLTQMESTVDFVRRLRDADKTGDIQG